MKQKREYPNVKSVAAYARYSTDMQTENSIAFQMESIEKFCKENDFIITHKYKDEAKSGTNTNRLNFQMLCTAAKNHEFDAVIIYDITRGSRDVADWFNFRKAMMMLNVEVISVEDNLGDLMNPNDFLVELLGVGIGQHHVLTTRQKSIEGITTRAEQGLFMGGIPPFGYDVIDQHYVVNPVEASVVNLIFRLYAEGYSYREIITEIEKTGVKTKRGGRWSNTTINALLHNERYIGTYYWNKHKCKVMGKWAGGGPNEKIVRIPDGMPGIVEQNIWEICQKRLHSHAMARSKSNRIYLLSGLLTCASCNGSYCGETRKNGRGYEMAYYICANRKQKRNDCTSPSVNAKKLDEQVEGILTNYINSFSDSMVEFLYKKINAGLNSCEEEKKQLTVVNNKIANITKCISNGVFYPELKEEMDQYQAEKIRLTTLVSNSSSRYISYEDVKKLLTDKISSCDNIITMVRTFVVSALVNQDKSITLNLGVVDKHNSERGIRTLDTAGMNRVL